MTYQLGKKDALEAHQQLNHAGIKALKKGNFGQGAKPKQTVKEPGFELEADISGIFSVTGTKGETCFLTKEEIRHKEFIKELEEHLTIKDLGRANHNRQEQTKDEEESGGAATEMNGVRGSYN
eukprot:Pgem_evm1s1834